MAADPQAPMSAVLLWAGLLLQCKATLALWSTMNMPHVAFRSRPRAQARRPRVPYTPILTITIRMQVFGCLLQPCEEQLHLRRRVVEVEAGSHGGANAQVLVQGLGPALCNQCLQVARPCRCVTWLTDYHWLAEQKAMKLTFVKTWQGSATAHSEDHDMVTDTNVAIWALCQYKS